MAKNVGNVVESKERMDLRRTPGFKGDKHGTEWRHGPRDDYRKYREELVEDDGTDDEMIDEVLERVMEGVASGREMEVIETDGDGDEGNERRSMPQDALLTQENRPWSKQPNEPILWYERFVIYYLTVDMSLRSILRAYNVFAGKNINAAPPTWYSASKKYDWEERARQYDTARVEHRKELVAGVEVAIEEEAKNALLVALRKAVEKVQEENSNLDAKTALNAIPRLVKQIQEIYGVGEGARTNKSLQSILEMLPDGLAQRVLVKIDKRQVNFNVSNPVGKPLSPKKIIDGAVKELQGGKK